MHCVHPRTSDTGNRLRGGLRPRDWRCHLGFASSRAGLRTEIALLFRALLVPVYGHDTFGPSPNGGSPGSPGSIYSRLDHPTHARPRGDRLQFGRGLHAVQNVRTCARAQDPESCASSCGSSYTPSLPDKRSTVREGASCLLPAPAPRACCLPPRPNTTSRRTQCAGPKTRTFFSFSGWECVHYHCWPWYTRRGKSREPQLSRSRSDLKTKFSRVIFCGVIGSRVFPAHCRWHGCADGQRAGCYPPAQRSGALLDG